MLTDGGVYARAYALINVGGAAAIRCVVILGAHAQRGLVLGS